jgi:hypothetical protein
MPSCSWREDRALAWAGAPSCPPHPSRTHCPLLHPGTGVHSLCDWVELNASPLDETLRAFLPTPLHWPFFTMPCGRSTRDCVREGGRTWCWVWGQLVAQGLLLHRPAVRQESVPAAGGAAVTPTHSGGCGIGPPVGRGPCQRRQSLWIGTTLSSGDLISATARTPSRTQAQLS